MPEITTRDVIDYIVEGEKITDPIQYSMFTPTLDNACARGAGRVAYGLENNIHHYISLTDFINSRYNYKLAEMKLCQLYQKTYGTTIENDNDMHLGREKTIQRIKDLYSEV